MTYAALVVGLLIFALGLKLTRSITTVQTMLQETRGGLAVMSDRSLSDDEKETAIQRLAIRMFGFFLSITARLAIAIVASLGVVYAGVLAGLYSQNEVIAASTNWYFLGAATVAMIGAWKFLK